MPTDLMTANRGYQKPHADNDLSHDIARLIAALDDIDTDTATALAAIAALAPLDTPIFTGIPQAPTAVPGASTSQLANTAFVQAAIIALIDASPGALDTLNELAAALGDDADFAGTMTSALAGKADNAATTAALALKLGLPGGTMTGNINLDGNELQNPDITGAMLVNGVDPIIFRRSEKTRDSSSYSTTTTTAYAASASSVTIAPKTPTTKLRVTAIMDVRAASSSSTSTGSAFQLKRYDGTAYVDADGAYGTPLITGLGSSSNVLDDVVTLVTELSSAEVRSDTGDWTVRVYYNTQYSSGTTTIYNTHWIIEEIEE